jgi:cytochrome c-type biogenesis protein CcmE
VKARTKFLLGGVLILGAAGYLMAGAIKSTGTYYLTPTELSTKIAVDPSLYHTGVKVGARVVPGSIVRQPGGRETSFRMTDGVTTYPVVYTGITPDTFTDSVDVVVEGRLWKEDQAFHATTLLAKCASRYEDAPSKPGEHTRMQEQYLRQRQQQLQQQQSQESQQPPPAPVS